MTENKVEILRWFEKIGKLYKTEYLKKFDLLHTNEQWDRFLIYNYFYERSGAAKVLKINAIKVYNSGRPLNEFKQTGNNEKRNPSSDDKFNLFDSSKLIQHIKSLNFNAAYQYLNLKGIGDKIKCVIIRDLDLYTNKSERIIRIEDLEKMFPIDIWVEIICKLLLNSNNKKIALRQQLINEALKNNLDCRYINSGMWFFAANIVADKETLVQVLNEAFTNVRRLEDEFKLMNKDNFILKTH
jgi:hypothetical protein